MKLLFITANRIGDAVLSTGILQFLVEQHPLANVTVATGPAAATLFRSAPNVERVIIVEKQPMCMHWVNLWRACAGTRWDMVIDLRRSAIAWTLRTKRRCIIPKSNKEMHRVRLLAATIGLEDTPPSPTLWSNDRDFAAATNLVPDGSPILALAPAANWKGKQWDCNNFSRLAEVLTAKDGILPAARIAVIAAAKERKQVEVLFQTFSEERIIDLVGRADLTEITACLKRCHFFIGNDSGLTHMAAAVDLPTLSLFGPSHPELYAPWGKNTAWVKTPETYEELVGAPDYDHKTTESLMNGLTVDIVESAARSLWHRTQLAGI